MFIFNYHSQKDIFTFAHFTCDYYTHFLHLLEDVFDYYHIFFSNHLSNK